MSDYREELSKSFTHEIAATIGRIDELIGDAHWPSVGSYKESVIRRQLMDYMPGRYTVGTGFVMSVQDGKPVRSRQIDILIWDSHNYGPIFRDGAFVVIPPQALRVAIEVKSTLTSAVLHEALENLDSLTQFEWIVFENHLADPNARSGFLRFVVAASSKLKFPDDVLRHIYRYYLRCIYDPEDPTDQHVELSMTERLALTQSPFPHGMTPWISGIAALGAGMVRAVRADTQVGYVVSNVVATDREDHTIGMVRASIDRFLTTDVLRQNNRDYAMTGREMRGVFMPVPNSTTKPTNPSMELFDLGDEQQNWTLEDAKKAKAKKDERKRKKEEAVGQDEEEDSGDGKR
jgi:hypothetical protein